MSFTMRLNCVSSPAISNRVLPFRKISTTWRPKCAAALQELLLSPRYVRERERLLRRWREIRLFEQKDLHCLDVDRAPRRWAAWLPRQGFGEQPRMVEGFVAFPRRRGKRPKRFPIQRLQDREELAHIGPDRRDGRQQIGAAQHVAVVVEMADDRDRRRHRLDHRAASADRK